jgi:hypothetical protein
MTPPTTKEELLTAVSDHRKVFASLIHSIDPAQMEVPGVEADWSVKDIVAHICSWEASMCRWLETAVRGETPDRPQSEADIDRMNGDFTAVNAQKSLAMVLAEFDALEAKIVAAVTAVPEDTLFTPGIYAWRPPQSPLWHMVGGNTFWHHEEHAASINAYLQQNKA